MSSMSSITFKDLFANTKRGKDEAHARHDLVTALLKFVETLHKNYSNDREVAKGWMGVMMSAADLGPFFEQTLGDPALPTGDLVNKMEHMATYLKEKMLEYQNP